ncbi:LuxR C-terminal-related transcriptional regulator [Vibrio sp. E150_011]
MNNSNVIILDNQPLFSEAIKDIVSHLNPRGVTIHTKVSDAYKYAITKPTDIILLDVDLIDGSGVDMISRLRARSFNGKALFISSKDYTPYSSITKTAGANGYVSKLEDKATITNAIVSISQGYNFFKNDAVIDMSQVELSHRELCVLELLGKGHSNKEVARHLLLSEKTISTYKSRIMKKYNVDSFVHVLSKHLYMSATH